MRFSLLILAAFAATVARADDRVKPDEKMSEVAGAAEVLFSVPKKFATLKGVDVRARKATLLIEGEKAESTWPLSDDAEIKIHGFWGRLDQFTPGDRVWAWFKLDRKKRPVALHLLADQLSEQDIHGTAKTFTQMNGTATRITLDASEFEKRRIEQRETMARRWEKEGLPGTMMFAHISGEADVLLDHEAIRWGRSLDVGAKVKIAGDTPVEAVVKSVKPWRERTLVRIVVKGLEIGDLKSGERLLLKTPTPSKEKLDSPLPPDVDLKRSKEERLDWFLSSIYCTCKVKGDRCTGMFYTLASCNPNACGTPNAMRKHLSLKIDKGMTDRQIFEELLKTYGPELSRPHLLQ